MSAGSSYLARIGNQNQSLTGCASFHKPPVETAQRGNLLEQIGNSPLVRLNGTADLPGVEICLKLAFTNPGGWRGSGGDYGRGGDEATASCGDGAAAGIAGELEGSVAGTAGVGASGVAGLPSVTARSERRYRAVTEGSGVSTGNAVSWRSLSCPEAVLQRLSVTGLHSVAIEISSAGGSQCPYSSPNQVVAKLRPDGATRSRRSA